MNLTRENAGILAIGGLCLLLILAGIGAVGGVFATATSQETGEISSCGVVIDEPGTHTLVNDLETDEGGEYCIEVRADDVIIDGQGHEIRSSEVLVESVEDDGGDLAMGIEVGEKWDDMLTNVAVENVHFVDLERGIFARYLFDAAIRNNEFRADNVDLDVRYPVGLEAGVELEGTLENVTVTDNEYSDWFRSVYVRSLPEGPDELTISENTILRSNWSSTSKWAVSVEGHSDIESADVVIEANEFIDSRFRSGFPADVYISQVPNVTIRDNTHTNPESTVYQLGGSDGVEVRNNSIDMEGNNASKAVLIGSGSDDAVFADNTIMNVGSHGPGTAIDVSHVDNTSITNNQIHHVGFAVWDEGDGTTLSDNVISDTWDDEEDVQNPAIVTRYGSTEVDNTTLDGTRLDGDINGVQVTRQSTAPVLEQDYESVGVFFNFTRDNHLHEPWADLEWHYGPLDTTDLTESDLRLIRYDHDRGWWMADTPGSVNETTESVAGNVTTPGTVGLFEMEAVPDATFLASPETPMENEVVTFDASASSAFEGVGTYHWNFGDGTTDTTTEPTIDHVYTEAGTYEVELAIDDGNGVYDVTDGTIEVTAPEAVFETGTAPFEVDETLSFYASESSTPADEIVEYRWDFTGNGTVDETTSDPVVGWSYDATGQYEIELEIEDSFGNVNSTTRTITVTAVGDTVWSDGSFSSVHGTSAVENDMVYVTARDDSGVLVAYDANTGAVEWSVEVEETFGSAPTVANGTVYAGDDEGTLHAFDADNGSERWTNDDGRDAIAAAPTVQDGTVYVADTDGFVIAVNASSGEREWRYSTSGSVQSPLVVHDGTVFAGDSAGNLYALIAETDDEFGDEAWQVATGRSISVSPAVVDDMVVVANTGGLVSAYNLTNGDEEWSHRLRLYSTGEVLNERVHGSTVPSGIATDGDSLYVPSNNFVTTLDPASGDVEWQAELNERLSSPPTITDEEVYVGGLEGTVFSLDTDSGLQQLTYETADEIESAPEIYGSVGYVGSQDGSAYAFHAGPPPLEEVRAGFTHDPFEPEPGETVTFDASHSGTPDGELVEYRWDFTNDSTVDETTSGPQATWSFDDPYDTYHVTLEVETDAGETATFDRPVGVDPAEWEFDVSGTWSSSPTIVNGTVFAIAVDDGTYLYAIDEETGEKQWRADIGQGAGDAPAVADGTVYVRGIVPGDWSDDHYLFAIDAETGEEQWRYEAEWDLHTAPTIVDGTVYIGSTTGLYALEADQMDPYSSYADEDELWRFNTDGSVRTAPIIEEGIVYVGTSNGYVHALETDPTYEHGSHEDGDDWWTFETGDTIYSAPTVYQQTVYFGSGDGNVYALDAILGLEEWRFETGDAVVSSPTVADGIVYVGSHDNHLYALDADPDWDGGTHEHGDEVWRVEADDSLVSSPTVAGGTVYVGSGFFSLWGSDIEDTRLFAVNADGGDVEWTFDAGGVIGYSPTVANGTVYVPANDGRLTALNESVSGWSEGSRVELRTLGHHDYVPPVSVEINNRDSTRHVLRNETVEIVVDAQNNEEWAQSEEITLDIPGLGSDSQTIDLDANEKTQIVLNVTTDEGDTSSTAYRATISGSESEELTLVTVSEPGDPTLLLGDVTGSGEVGLSDSILVQEHVEGVTDLGAEGYLVDMADMKRDGHITLADAILVTERASDLRDRPEIAVNNVTVPSSVNRGVDLEVTAELENDDLMGAIQGVNVSLIDDDEVVASTQQTVDMAAPDVTNPVDLASSATVTFLVDTMDVETGEYEVNVSSEADFETAPVTVEEGAFFDVEITDLEDEVVAGESITVGYEVNYTGDEETTLDIPFEVNGVEKAVEQNVTLDSNDSWVDTFTYETDEDDVPSIELTISTVGYDTATQDDFETVTVAVVEPEGPPSLPGFEDPPQDLSDDGLYEDIDGDGESDVLDVQVLFENLYEHEVQEYAEFYDFARLDSDNVTIFDVQALFNYMQQNG